MLNSDKINLNLGKIPPSILKSVVFNNNSKNLFLGPGIGLDFSVVKIDKKYLISSSDPVTGIKKNIGIYVVNLCANDIAVSGNSPNFFQSIILLPTNSDTTLLESIVNDINYATSKLGIEITGGHTEVTNIVDQPLVIGTAFSAVDKFVSNKNIREGDMILMTKTAGIEGTLIIENMFDTSNNTSKSYKKQLIRILEDSDLDTLEISSFWGMKNIKLSKGLSHPFTPKTNTIPSNPPKINSNTAASTNSIDELLEENTQKEKNIKDHRRKRSLYDDGSSGMETQEINGKDSVW